MAAESTLSVKNGIFDSRESQPLVCFWGSPGIWTFVFSHYELGSD